MFQEMYALSFLIYCAILWHRKQYEEHRNHKKLSDLWLWNMNASRSICTVCDSSNFFHTLSVLQRWWSNSIIKVHSFHHFPYIYAKHVCLPNNNESRPPDCRLGWVVRLESPSARWGGSTLISPSSLSGPMTRTKRTSSRLCAVLSSSSLAGRRWVCFYLFEMNMWEVRVSTHLVSMSESVAIVREIKFHLP